LKIEFPNAVSASILDSRSSILAPFSGSDKEDRGITVHRLLGRFGPRDLEILDRFLTRLPKPCRLLVQYVPHAFGCKGMNIPFCWWLSRRPEPVWIVFHEVVFPFSGNQPLAHNILGVATRLMVTLVARRAERIFITIPNWEALLPSSPNVHRRVTWLPVPSNIPITVTHHAVSEVRRQIAPANETVIGHFGTYGPVVTGLLMEILPPLLRKDSERRALLVGRNSDRFAVTLRQANPVLQGQIEATGPLEPDKIAAHLAACDCLVQPFIDGVSSRRTSLMAGLALGLPIVTNAGRLTDPVWKKTDAVLLAPSPSASGLRDTVENLLGQPKRLSELRRHAAGFYQRNFALSRTIEILRTGTTSQKLASSQVSALATCSRIRKECGCQEKEIHDAPGESEF
jgi:glycosyltransferase involved in cell wall biosynthesis